MLKTVKNGSEIRVDPPLFFFQNSHIFPFFFGRRPLRRPCFHPEMRRDMKYTPIIIKLRPREATNERDSVLIANQEVALPRYF